ncbi:hypothetical protein TRVA0_010S00474 [Trichomonascus vanleenenianus]|uniref:uncharacterized protein n=1 Tax=Trichomonascus vanleenenianus TaxID=2268995 RepID=UPI003ECBA7AD
MRKKYCKKKMEIDGPLIDTVTVSLHFAVITLGLSVVNDPNNIAPKGKRIDTSIFESLDDVRDIAARLVWKALKNVHNGIKSGARVVQTCNESDPDAPLKAPNVKEFTYVVYGCHKDDATKNCAIIVCLRPGALQWKDFGGTEPQVAVTVSCNAAYLLSLAKYLCDAFGVRDVTLYDGYSAVFCDFARTPPEVSWLTIDKEDSPEDDFEIGFTGMFARGLRRLKPFFSDRDWRDGDVIQRVVRMFATN